MSIAVEVVDAVKDALTKSISETNGRVYHVLSEEEVIALAAALPYPSMAVTYEGIRAKPEGLPSHRKGAAGTVGVALILFYKTAAALGYEQREANNRAALEILDQSRKAMMDTAGPNGKTWEFVAEIPAYEKSGVVVWIQRWALPAILL